MDLTTFGQNASDPVPVGESKKLDESVDIDEDDIDGVSDKIIESLTSKYTEFEGSELLGKTIEHLRENIRPGICLICIEDIERNEAVWSCKSCHCIHHLVCIQRWAKDSMLTIREKAAHQGFNLPIIWCCPKCRKDYTEQEYPDVYKCFCGKVVNPKNDLWVAPHSCGDVCGKPLQPECGHPCVLLCHSGTCPPCPKYVTTSCYCQKSAPQTRRCFAKDWACDSVCEKDLPCNVHSCKKTCHDGDCPPCEVPVTLYCRCSSPSPLVFPCHKVTTVDENGKHDCVVSCGKKCKKPLNCGIHTCDKECHEDNCGVCQITCPCGKDAVACSGTERGPGKPCNNECQRPLNCGIHTCTQKCHQGSCGLCLQIVVKKCRCGQLEKEVSCSKDLVCEFKCKKLKDCKLHVCNRKCCIECPPCTSTCGKTLACKNHKCESSCNHVGQCYPCPVTVQVKCKCGSTIRQVPCGFERKCKPPECSKLCEKPSKCDHPRIQNHRCHFGDCPKCNLVCGKEMSCKHTCKKACHSMKQKGNNNGQNAGKSNPPCGPCKELVLSDCKQHSDVEVKCFKRYEKCEEVCMRTLDCGRHFCSKICHAKIDPDGCGTCQEPCSVTRPQGCHHQCDLGCHQGPCSLCTLVAKITCHCGQEELMVQCYKQAQLSESQRSCKNQCIRKLSCHHRCLRLCHSGDCDGTENEKCRRKVKLTCKCKHVKRDVECFMIPELCPDGKFLDCNPPTCNIPKSPRESQPGTSKKRNRKKKSSEGDKDCLHDATDSTEVSKDNQSESLNEIQANSGSSGNLMKILAICVLIGAALLYALLNDTTDTVTNVN